MDTLRIIDPSTKQSVAWTWDQLREFQTKSQIVGTDSKGRPATSPINIDTTWYMEQGPGTYFNPELFSGVRETLAKSTSSLNLQNGQSVNLSTLVAADKLTARVSHYTTDIQNETWDIRSLVWGGTSARIAGNVTNIDGNLYLTDYKIIPWNDNFNFFSDSENPIKTMFNATYRTFNEGTHRGVPMDFDGSVLKTITKPYGLNDMNIDSANNKSIFGISSKNTLLNGMNNAAEALKINCFLAGTRIQLPSGAEIAIENVASGDMVLSFDSSATDETNQLAARRVTQVFRGFTTTIVNLRGLYCTPGHLFLNGSYKEDQDTNFISISSALKEDGLLLDVHGNYIRARTGARKGTLDDRPVKISTFDQIKGREIIITVRAGIPVLAELHSGDPAKRTALKRPLYHWLKSKNIAIDDHGQLHTSCGRVFVAVDWPSNSTPFDVISTENWIISVEDQGLYVPKWIAALPDPVRETASEQLIL